MPLLESLLLYCDVTHPTVKLQHPDLPDGIYLNTVEHAALSGRSDVINTLLSAGFEVELFRDDTEFFSQFGTAMDHAHPNILNGLFTIRLGCSIFSSYMKATLREDDRTINALGRAAAGGHSEIVEILLRLGVNPSANIVSGIPPLYLAIRSSHIETINILLQYDASIENPFYGLPLAYAAGLGNAEIVKILLPYGRKFPGLDNLSDCLRVTESKDIGTVLQIYLSPSPLYEACRNGLLDIVSLLVSRGIAPTSLVRSTSYRCGE